ncbi:MAG: bifunctional shikimate kinase/3-dehydroquinate synthase [Candidatus Limnocylindrus sp.]
MDLILVGLPGAGKSSLGRKLATRLSLPYLDLDRAIIAETGVPDDNAEKIFAREGEDGFRSRERAAIAALTAAKAPATRGAANDAALGEAAALGIDRIVSLGGGALIDPRNRWALAGKAHLLWIDAPNSAIAARLREAKVVRPIFRGEDPLRHLPRLRAERERFYATGLRLTSARNPASLADEALRLITAQPTPERRLIDAALPTGRWILGEGIAASALLRELRARRAARVVIVTEPNAARALGDAAEVAIHDAGIEIIRVDLPSGEAAKRLEVIGAAASTLARAGVERGDLIVAIGGGALTDAAGMLAALYLRGIDWIAIPTTLAGQLDASLGGKTGVDLPEGKNLIGAFHQPRAVIADLRALRSLPAREIVAALGEAVKVALLGDERLFALLESAAERLTAADQSVHDDGTLAEIVERAGWWKCEVVRGDEREAAGRISLNLGHTLAHALEQATNYSGILHGEAVGYGLRAALQIGVELGVTPRPRAERAAALLDRLGLGVAPRNERAADLLTIAQRDKKVAAGKIRWVLPTGDGYTVRDDLPASLVESAVTAALAGRAAQRTAMQR